VTTEIRRSDWSRFCKKFSQNNQFRPAQVRVTESGHRVVATAECFPLVGMALRKRGRLIDGIELYTGQPVADPIAEPVVTVMDPAEVILEKDPAGTDRALKIKSKDGAEARIEFSRESVPDLWHDLIEKAAYALYERRGLAHGDDRDDWHEARRRLEQLGQQFIQ